MTTTKRIAAVVLWRVPAAVAALGGSWLTADMFLGWAVENDDDEG